MKNLTHEQVIHLQGKLAQRQMALRRDIHREIDAMDNYTAVASEAPDPGDSSFADLSIDLGNAAVNRDVIELRAIDAARARMQSGMYGECIECGYAIPFERLLAQPIAERCAPCQEMFEKTHAEAGRGATL